LHSTDRLRGCCTNRPREAQPCAECAFYRTLLDTVWPAPRDRVYTCGVH